MVAQQQQQHAPLGADTFRGTGSSSGTRAAFFGKTAAETTHQRNGLLKVSSPVSGFTLTAPDRSGASQHAAIKDPLTGTVLRLGGQTARIVTPAARQPQVYSRRFYLIKDIDISIATLRATNTVSDKTNEKLGTSGTATGLDSALVSGRRLRCSIKKKQQEEQQSQEECRGQ